MAIAQTSDCAARLLDQVAKRGGSPDQVLARLKSFAIETPSWGYAHTGTRFG